MLGSINTDNKARLSIAMVAAKRASVEIKQTLDTGSEIDGLELKAVADDRANLAIINAIRSSFPEDAILTEEIGFPELPKDSLWVIDPLDGTTNFLNKSRMYSILISYIENGAPVVSVVYLPGTSDLLVSVTGNGAYLNGSKLVHTGHLDLRKASVALDPGYDPDGGKKVAETFLNIRPKVGNVVMLGGNGYALATMAMGELAGYVHFASKVWEVAGLHLLQEAGGRVTGLDGEPLNLNFKSKSSFEFAASMGVDHAKFLALINLK